MIKFQPIIKWTGSKRNQSNEILNYFPKSINTYYEPFCGGCSVLRTLLDSNISVQNYICSDINEDLINLWNEIKFNPSAVFETYKNLWNQLNSDNDINRKKQFFELQRSLYNSSHNPYIFFFIMRTTTNGMPRYNKLGEFNNSFHLTRNGIHPNRLLPILLEWNTKLLTHNVQFKCCSYEEILKITDVNDFVYMDPPYFNTKGIYFDNFNSFNLFENLRMLNDKNVKYAMSFDGISGNVDNTCNIPIDCYTNHFYLKSGKSSFKRIIGKDNDAMVFESLYINF